MQMQHLLFIFWVSSLQSRLHGFLQRMATLQFRWNEMTIPHHYALPCTPETVHSTLSNCRI